MSDYIDNKRFEYLIQSYSSDNKENEEELFNIFSLLIDRLMNGFSFKVDKEEAKQECLLLILKVLRNFDKSRGAAFNYFTTIILNNLRLIYTKRKKYLDKIQSYTEYKTGIYNPSSAPIEPL